MALTVFDTGVLIGFLNSSDAHHARAIGVVAALRSSGDQGVIPASVYAELLVQPFRRGTSEVKLVDDALDALVIRIEPITRAVAKSAAELRATHPSLRLPDALVVATARTLRATRLITTDARWPRFTGLKVEVI